MCLIKHNDLKVYWRSGGIAPLILIFGTRWRCVVIYRIRAALPPITIGLKGGWTPGRCGEEKISIISPSSNRTAVEQPIA
jgi:hypothetical protein